MLVKAFGGAVNGIDAHIITVETDVVTGVNFYIVGLPDNAVKESQQRVDSALRSVGYRFPVKKITVNMAPADMRKEGTAYDLPIAVGILAASEQMNSANLENYLIMGELTLDGGVHRIKGALSMAIEARKHGFKGFILPKENAREAAVVNDLDVYGVESLREVADFFNATAQLKKTEVNTREEFFNHNVESQFDFSDVKGQENVKRAFEIAATGGHNMIMIGPPGAGKTMLSKRIASILPPLTLHEALETTKIHSVAGKLGAEVSLMTERPFRAPHHTVSDVALVGGGSFPQPGEISLAHNGVLFLDELPEFKRTVLEVMRQPLEDRKINISRARFSVDYPASFMLIASMNPCPCGYYNHPEKDCVCSAGVVQKYLNRISGPLLDRIDIHIEVIPVPFEELTRKKNGETSAEIRKRVIRGREIQQKRFEGTSIYCNAQMDTKMLHQYCELNEECSQILKQAMEKLGLSARAYDRIIKVSRTIADLDDSVDIQASHIAEAIQYRSLDRENWAG
ncbi:MAG: YifB family Mg chelatase-like AAA ATPase [Bacteroidales bacterium]|jgi:magnesium chelatase family protein|nr:YifB family Mg chelatase-like AAA ATPase [Bacteroidales bacterium]